MLYAIIGMSLLFVAIGFIVTENNAKYLLSGYNTMSEAERKQFDIKTFISYFRKFHIFLGSSFLVFGLILTYFVNPNVGGIFLGIYPLLAYFFLVWKSFKYSKVMSTKKNKISIYILVGTLIFVIGIFFFFFF